MENGMDANNTTSYFTKDIAKFSGENHTYTSTKRIQDLDDYAEIMGWTSIQKLVIVRTTLTGTAQLQLKTEKMHKTYGELKLTALKEFPESVTPARHA